MTYHPPRPLKCYGVSRDADNLAAISVVFSRRLSDDELRFFHEVCGRTAPLMEDTPHG